MSRTEFLIEIKGLSKSFGAVAANKNIDLTVKKGEILALLGENGSGKTTLMNMLSGLYSPDSGSIYVYRKRAVFRSPRDSIRLGIGMIHQHFKLVDVFTAKENIVLSDNKRSKKASDKKLAEITERFGLEVDLNKKIYDMSVSEKQTVEILKVLYMGANILILDEPTAVLTPQETERLFAILRKMKEEGCAVIIITHKLNEVMEISDTITVLRRGESVATVKTSGTNPGELTELMVGRAVDLAIRRDEAENSERLLEVKSLSAFNHERVRVLKDINFSLYKGEILGVAGVAGSGQRELCEAIAGLYPVASGEMLYHSGENSESIVGKSPREIIKMGISMSFIPEDRLGMGLVASMSITDNLLLKSYQDANGPFIKRKPAALLAERLVEKLGIVTPGINTPVCKLSGGNVQKVLLGREIESDPNLLITAYPVRGLDINSSYIIYELLSAQKAKGVGVLYIGEDLDVILELCDRVMVLCGGEVTGIVNAKDVTKEEVGLMMLGYKAGVR